ncbi:MAG: pilus assembly protein PilM [Planctomycetes bacterium]|nr:pilus assembly protein PilM [Planctomycetota bacterium]
MASPIYTGIDIGADSLKVVSLRRKGNSFQLLGAGLAHVPNDIPEDQDATKIIGGILSRMIRSQKIPIGHTVIGLGSKGSLIRCLSEPICPRWKLAMLMDFEVEEQAGSTAAVAYDFRPLDLPEFQEGQFSVLLGQAQASVVEERLTLARESIKRADELDMNCLGVFNLYAISPQCDEEKVTLILDIGAEETNVSLQQGSAFYFARTISGGGRRFTSRIQQELKISFEAAEELKLEAPGIIPDKIYAEEEVLTIEPEDILSRSVQANGPDYLVSKACRTEASVLASSVQSSLVFFRNQLVKSSGTDPRNPKLEIIKPQHILLTGGGSKLGGLGEVLGERLRCTTEKLNIAGALPDCQGSAELAIESANAPHFATAIGLALSRARDAGFGFNILTESEKERRKFWERKFYLVAASVAAVILIVFSIMSSNRGLKAAEELDEKWRLRIDEVQQEQAELEQAKADNAMRGEMVNILENYRSAGLDTLKALDIIRRNTPEDFFFTNFLTLNLVDQSKSTRRNTTGGPRGASSSKTTSSESADRRILLEGFCLAKSEQESAARLSQLITDLAQVDDNYFEKVKQIKYTEAISDEKMQPYFMVDGKSLKPDNTTRAFSFSLECFIRPRRQ